MSVNWLEYFGNIPRNDQLDKLRSALKKALPYIRPSAKIAVLNVTESVDYVKNNTPNSIDIRVLHKPTKDESHSGIFETILDEAIISELLADCVAEPLYPAM